MDISILRSRAKKAATRYRTLSLLLERDQWDKVVPKLDDYEIVLLEKMIKECDIVHIKESYNHWLVKYEIIEYMNLADLRRLAQERGVKCYVQMCKTMLLASIKRVVRDHQNNNNQEIN